MNRIKIRSALVCAVVVLSAGAALAQGQDLATISKRIVDAGPGSDMTSSLESARALYLKENDYNGMVHFLESLSKKKRGFAPQFDYYVALTRYHQLRFLEERQLWDEYFNRGNEYREDIVERADRARTQAAAADVVRLKAGALLWQFHHFQQDAFVEQALDDLMKDVESYAQTEQDALLLKDVADMLSDAEERAPAKRVYDVYIRRLASKGLSEPEYASTARQFYEDGNLDLAESMYDMYREKLVASSKDDPAALAQALKGIALQFVYATGRPSDPGYAEEVFAQAQSYEPVETWEEPVLYARAYNLEKIKDFAAARQMYQLLLTVFPASATVSEARYKSGLIAAYALGDLSAGRADFKAVSEGDRQDHPYAGAGLYQLGVLAQWEGDFASARALYTKAAAHGSAQQETVGLAQARLTELKEGRPLEDNLKTFLDITFGPDKIMYTMQKASLTCVPAAVSPHERLGVQSEAMIGSTGCFAVGLQYLWSGNLGEARPGPNESFFTTSYAERGAKDIKLVVVSPTGIVDRAFDIVDVK